MPQAGLVFMLRHPIEAEGVKEYEFTGRGHV